MHTTLKLNVKWLLSLKNRRKTEKYAYSRKYTCPAMNGRKEEEEEEAEAEYEDEGFAAFP